MITDRTIAGVFNSAMGASHSTMIIGGASEPLYLPRQGRDRAIVRYTRDYARSALHELAHWALAGNRRRELVDYGYWYVPPPRSVEDQAAFFAAELRVQALESLFCRACGLDFRVSTDNIGVDAGNFAEDVQATAGAWAEQGVTGLPGRLLQLFGGLGKPHE
jgi:elongation factor P hydroxylase